MSDSGTIVACTSAGTGTEALTLKSTFTRSPMAVTLLTLPADRPRTRTSDAGNRAMVLGNQALSFVGLSPPPPMTEHDDNTTAASTTKEAKRSLRLGIGPPEA